MKYFIISQPKSGTYLASNLLRCFGIMSENYHLSESLYQKYPDNYIKNGRPVEFTHRVELAKSVNLIKEGTHAVGHIPYSKKNNETLNEFTKILITRSHKDIQESLERFKKNAKRSYLKFDKKEIENIEKWKTKTNIFHITFEDLIEKNKEKIDQLQIYLFGEIRFDSEEKITQALEMNSMTKSSIRQ